MEREKDRKDNLSEILLKKLKEEEEHEKLEAERLRDDYLRRTGRSRLEP